MTCEEAQHAAGWLARARETLGAAEVLLLNERYADAVNRLYYACFYAVTGLLFSEGLSSKKHSGVAELFDRRWVRPGRLPREMSEFYHEMFDRRLYGDYRLAAAFGAADVQSWFTEATRFVERIESALREETGDHA